MALFVGMVLYFGVMLCAARHMMRANDRFLSYEEYLAHERAGLASPAPAHHARGLGWYRATGPSRKGCFAGTSTLESALRDQVVRRRTHSRSL